MREYDDFRSEKRSFGGRNSQGSTMHKAVCDECGRDCEVPFKPSSDKPVYCSDCFEKKGGGSDSKRSFGRNDRNDRGRGRSSFGDKEMFSAVCDKCGKDCKVPFRPSGEKPIYCSDCFEKKENTRGSGSSSNNDALFGKIDAISAKLDKLIMALEKLVAEEPKAKKVAVKKPKAKKTAKKAVKAKKD